MSSKNVETLRLAHENWNRRDLDATVSVVAPEVTYVDQARGITLKTRDEFKQWLKSWAQACSDGKITEPRYIDAGDTVVTQFTARGTNDGPLGPFPATGRSMKLEFCEVSRFDGSGRVISGAMYYDQFTLFSQLGHIKQPASAAKA